MREKGNREGVFSHTTDQAAFVDCVRVSIQGVRRKEMKNGVLNLKNRAIGGPKSVYARAMDGWCNVIGNSFQQRYGQMRPFKRIPPVQLTLFSTRTPLSCAQLEFVSSLLMRKNCRLQMSQAELTFDLSDSSVNFFVRHLQSTARKFRVFKNRGTGIIGTYYVGGRRSPWQVRIYRKTDDVVRLEFIFRRAFLKRHRIRCPHDLVLLRKLDLTKLVWLRKLNRNNLRSMGNPMTASPRDRVLGSWARMFNPAEFATVLKKNNITRPDLFVRCRLEEKLIRMQRKLIW